MTDTAISLKGARNPISLPTENPYEDMT
jgi:hypothetical protein